MFEPHLAFSRIACTSGDSADLPQQSLARSVDSSQPPEGMAALVFKLELPWLEVVPPVLMRRDSFCPRRNRFVFIGFERSNLHRNILHESQLTFWSFSRRDSNSVPQLTNNSWFRYLLPLLPHPTAPAQSVLLGHRVLYVAGELESSTGNLLQLDKIKIWRTCGIFV